MSNPATQIAAALQAEGDLPPVAHKGGSHEVASTSKSEDFRTRSGVSQGVQTESFYATFGGGHEYRGFYLEVIAPSYAEATNVVIAAHGQRWANLYTAKDFEGMADAFRLLKLATIRQTERGYWKADHPRHGGSMAVPHATSEGTLVVSDRQSLVGGMTSPGELA